MKRPSFQFYPADWRKDAALQSCSLESQGLWINIMCIAHECDPYGYLVVNGKPMNHAQIGRLVGVSQKEANTLIAELNDAGVLSIADNGAIFSRRMVRDESVRNSRAAGGKEGAEHGKKGAEFGKKGGRPKKETGDKNPPLFEEETGDKKPPLEPPPSSSSSSSSTKPSEQSSPVPQTESREITTEVTTVSADSVIPDTPTTEGHWLSWFNREAGTQFDASSRFDRADLWPIFSRWCKAGISQAQMRTAIKSAQDMATSPIANLPKYVDRVLSNSQAPKSRTIHDEREAVSMALTGRKPSHEQPIANAEPRDITGESVRVA